MVVIELALPSIQRFDHGLSIHAAAQIVRGHFPLVESVVDLGAGRFGVLAHRHPGLGVALAELEAELRSDPDVAALATIWLAPLPGGRSMIPGFVRRLTEEPLGAFAVACSESSSGDPDAEAVTRLTHVSPPTGAVEAPRRLERLRAALVATRDSGGPVMAAALAAMMLIVAVGRAVDVRRGRRSWRGRGPGMLIRADHARRYAGRRQGEELAPRHDAGR